MYRISKLNQFDRRLYHTSDLALLWGINNRQSLYVALSRYLEKGVLFPVYKGLYSTVPVGELDPLELGRAVIHRYTYLTTESVLAQAGVISQAVHAHTFASELSRKVVVQQHAFVFRRLKAEALLNPAGIIEREGGYVATPERAAADMLHFSPRYHFDLPESLDLEKVAWLQKEIGYR